MHKQTIYFKRNEYIVKFKVNGYDTITKIEFETNLNQTYEIGKAKSNGIDYDYEIP